jgi:hypothetical protein
VQALSGIEIVDETGAPVPIETLWNATPVVLAFVRHFG